MLQHLDVLSEADLEQHSADTISQMRQLDEADHKSVRGVQQFELGGRVGNVGEQFASLVVVRKHAL